MSVFTLLCLTQDPSPYQGQEGEKRRDLRWEDKVPVTPRKEASKQGGPTPPSSLMRPGDEAWRRPGFQPEFASPPDGSQAGCFLKAPVCSSLRGRDRPGLNSEPTPTFALDWLKLPLSSCRPHSVASPGFLRLQPPSRGQSQPGRGLQSDGLIAAFLATLPLCPLGFQVPQPPSSLG